MAYKPIVFNGCFVFVIVEVLPHKQQPNTTKSHKNKSEQVRLYQRHYADADKQKSSK